MSGLLQRKRPAGGRMAAAVDELGAQFILAAEEAIEEMKKV